MVFSYWVVVNERQDRDQGLCYIGVQRFFFVGGQDFCKEVVCYQGFCFQGFWVWGIVYFFFQIFWFGIMVLSWCFFSGMLGQVFVKEWVLCVVVGNYG